MTIYAINAATLGVSEYSGLNLTDLAVLNDRLYGVATDGLVEFSGTNDETVNIDAYVTTGKLSFGSMDEIRCRRAYVKEQYANELLLTTLIDTVRANEEAEENSVSYSVPGKIGAQQHARTVRLRSDVKGTSWQFKLANVDGGGMKVRELSITPEGIEVDV